MSSSCGALLREASKISWFSEASRPLSGVASQRIESWEQWAGPGFAGVEQLSLDLQAVKDEVDRAAPDSTSSWDECLRVAVETIAEFVPGYSASKDTWHAPTAAVWHAAWVINLHCLFVEIGRPVPSVVKDQMAWFAQGRWPSAYTPSTTSAAIKEYVVL